MRTHVRVTALSIVVAAGLFGQAVRPGFAGGTLNKRDDVASTAQALGFTINFYGTNYSSAYITDNGYITFDGQKMDHTPEGLRNNTRRIIAPFFADVDPSGAASSPVTWGQGTVNGRRAFAVNWVNVGYYPASTDKLNSFQLVLIERGDVGPGAFDFEFNYDRILWEAGSADRGDRGLCTRSGCISASAGYANGLTGAAGVSFEVPGSLVAGAFLDSNPTGLRTRRLGNSTVNGRLVFEARNGVVTAPAPTITSLSPSSAAAGAGPIALTIDGTGFVSGAAVRWTFGGQTQNLADARLVSATRMTATVPANSLVTAGTAQVVVANPAGSPSPGATFTVTASAPGISISTTGQAAQPGLRVALNSPATAAMTGTLTLTFAPDGVNVPANYMDPAVRFAAGGGTTLTFSLPAGANEATLPSNGQFQPGTVAGLVTATMTALNAGAASMLPNPRPATSVSVGRTAPVITPGSVRIVNTATGFDVELQGYSTVRQLTGANLTFGAAPNAALDGTTSFQVPITAAASAAWFEGADGRNNGSRFTLRLPFTVSGDSSAIGTVSVTVSNSEGSSAAVSGGR